MKQIVWLSWYQYIPTIRSLTKECSSIGLHLLRQLWQNNGYSLWNFCKKKNKTVEKQFRPSFAGFFEMEQKTNILLVWYQTLTTQWKYMNWIFKLKYRLEIFFFFVLLVNETPSIMVKRETKKQKIIIGNVTYVFASPSDFENIGTVCQFKVRLFF